MHSLMHKHLFDCTCDIGQFGIQYICNHVLMDNWVWRRVVAWEYRDEVGGRSWLLLHYLLIVLLLVVRDVVVHSQGVPYVILQLLDLRWFFHWMVWHWSFVGCAVPWIVQYAQVVLGFLHHWHQVIPLLPVLFGADC
jgi:hypothetical protein